LSVIGIEHQLNLLEESGGYGQTDHFQHRGFGCG
jgi:hypothetical protein